PQKRSIDGLRGREGLGLRPPEEQQVRRGRGGRRGRRERHEDRDRREAGRQTFEQRDAGLHGGRRLGIAAERKKTQQEAGRDRQKDERGRPPGDAGQGEERHRARHEDRSHGNREPDPAAPREAAVTRVGEERPSGQGTEKETREPERARPQPPRLRQTLPSGVSSTSLPGGENGREPKTTRKSACSSRRVGAFQTAEGRTLRPGIRPTARRASEVSRTALRGSATGDREAPAGITRAAFWKRR